MFFLADITYQSKCIYDYRPQSLYISLEKGMGSKIHMADWLKHRITKKVEYVQSRHWFKPSTLRLLYYNSCCGYLLSGKNLVLTIFRKKYDEESICVINVEWDHFSSKHLNLNILETQQDFGYQYRARSSDHLGRSKDNSIFWTERWVLMIPFQH